MLRVCTKRCHSIIRCTESEYMYWVFLVYPRVCSWTNTCSYTGLSQKSLHCIDWSFGMLQTECSSFWNFSPARKLRSTLVMYNICLSLNVTSRGHSDLRTTLPPAINCAFFLKLTQVLQQNPLHLQLNSTMLLTLKRVVQDGLCIANSLIRPQA